MVSSAMWSSIVIYFTALLGIVSSYPQGRVVNGTDSSIESYPYMVSLRGSTGSHSCGSTIIAPRWILTAAHCVNGRSASILSIQYASTVISATSTNVAKVKRIIIHEDYQPTNNYANDIALLQLFGQLVFNDKTLAPITLPEQGFEIPQVEEGAPGILVGWGLNATGGSLQSVIQEVNLKIYSDEECTTRHNGSTTVDHICGGVDEGGKGQCNGDSGGPLLYENHIQLGIVSWSIKPCTVYPYPGVYTKVSHYIDWIYENIDAYA